MERIYHTVYIVIIFFHLQASETIKFGTRKEAFAYKTEEEHIRANGNKDIIDSVRVDSINYNHPSDQIDTSHIRSIKN